MAMKTYKIEVLSKFEPEIIEFEDKNCAGMYFSYPTCNGNGDVSILTQIVTKSKSMAKEKEKRIKSPMSGRHAL
jgi:hypothetical protein